MSSPFAPMLAATIETEAQLAALTYPLIGMYKYDGIRAVIYNGQLLSRTLKPIPNKHINEVLAGLINEPTRDLWDGELLLLGKNYNEVQSAVMSREGSPDFVYKVFDRVTYNKQLNIYNGKQHYQWRLGWVEHLKHAPHIFNVISYAKMAPYYWLSNVEDVLGFEEQAIQSGFEGIILRSPSGIYKCGRSTLNEQYLMKFKRTEDAEGKILERIEMQHNYNTQRRDARGYAKRSDHKDNKVGAGILGSFKVLGLNGPYAGKVFNVSCGSMLHREREQYWLTQQLPSDTITYTFAKHRSGVDAPLEPRFKGFRKDI